MAQITWRNVDAPDFSGALDGIKTAAYLFGNAGKTLSDGLGDFRQYEQEQAANAATQNALKYTDPAAYQAALADGSLFNGVDTSQLSARTMNALSGRTSDLINNALNQESLDYKNYTFGREKTQNAALDAAAPVMAQISNAYASGDTRTAQRLMSENQDLLGGLTPDQIMAFNRENLGNTGTNLQNQSRAFELSRDQTNYAQERQIQAALGQVMNNSLTGTDVLTNASQLMQGMDPNTRAAFMGRINQMMPGTFGPQGGGVAGSPAGGGNVGTLMTGGAQLPSGYNTVGSVVDGKSDLLRANPQGTAVGPYQITSATWKQFGQQALGDNWKNADLNDPATHDKVAQAIWDSAKDSASKIKGRWDMFKNYSDDQMQQFVGKDWNQVKDTISRGESGVSLAQMTADTTAAGNVSDKISRAIQSRMSLDNNNISAQEWLTSTENGVGKNSSQIADELSKQEGFKGLGANWIQARINQIQSMPVEGSDGQPKPSGLSPAQAAVILKQSINAGSEGFWAGAGDFIKRNTYGDANADNGKRFDASKAEKLVQDSATGNWNTQATNNIMAMQNLQMLQGAQQQQYQALQVYQTALARRNAGQNIPIGQLLVYKQNYDLASSRVAGLQKTLQSDPLNVPPNWGKDRPNPSAKEAPIGGTGKPLNTTNDQTKRDAVNQAMQRGLEDLRRNSSVYYR